MEEPKLKEQIGRRLELLHQRINELIEQQKVTERQIKAYKELVRHYHAVYEAEHGLGTAEELNPEMIERLAQIITEPEATKETKGYKSVPEAVLEILSEKTDSFHAGQIANAIVEKYPAIEEQVKNIEKRVVVALVRGVQQGLYERVGRNIYRLKTRGK